MRSSAGFPKHRFALRLTALLAQALFGVALHAADLALAGGTVYPAPGKPAIGDAAIVIHNGRIASIGPRTALSISKKIPILDCSGKFIVAGFWNSHVHVFTPQLLHARDAGAQQLNTALDAMLNRWGFTTVFDLASVLENTLTLRRRIDSGELRGPRILTVGEPLWTKPPVYVIDYLAANHIEIPIVESPAGAAERVRALARHGADGIKLFTGSVQGRGKVANMPLDMALAAVREAHRLRLPVFAHPQNSAGLEVAIESGVDVLAHTAPGSPPWTPAFVGRLVRAHMDLIPTLTLFDAEARKDGEPDAEPEKWIEKMVDELRAFSAGGGEVLFGTDVGYTEHFDTTMEFRLMARAGMSFPQILASLTTNPARKFGYSGRSGRIAKGMDADVVVLDEDPGQDVAGLAKVRFVIRQGRLIYRAP